MELSLQNSPERNKSVGGPLSITFTEVHRHFRLKERCTDDWMTRNNLSYISRGKLATELRRKKQMLLDTTNMTVQLHTKSSFLKKKLTKNVSLAALRTTAPKKMSEEIESLIEEKNRLEGFILRRQNQIGAVTKAISSIATESVQRKIQRLHIKVKKASAKVVRNENNRAQRQPLEQSTPHLMSTGDTIEQIPTNNGLIDEIEAQKRRSHLLQQQITSESKALSHNLAEKTRLKRLPIS